jgi:hypothetical protein
MRATGAGEDRARRVLQDWLEVQTDPELRRSAGKVTQGYVATKFTKPIPVGRCPYDAAAG